MPIEACQTFKVLNARSVPCDSCQFKTECMTHLAWRQLFEAPDPLHFKKHLISRCSGYSPGRGAPWPQRGADITPSLSGAGVRNLCNGCDEAKEGTCGTHENLAEIVRTAAASGLFIAFTVYACKTRRPFLQIDEPQPAKAPQTAPAEAAEG